MLLLLCWLLLSAGWVLGGAGCWGIVSGIVLCRGAFYYYEFGALVLLRCPCRRLLHAADRRATCSVPVLM